MIEQTENPNIRKRLLKLIKSQKAYYSADIPNRIYPLMNGNKFLFDLDCLWAKPDATKELIGIINDVIKQENIDINLVTGLTTKAGAFGTVPISSIIAYEKKIRMLVFDEEQFCEYGIHPHTLVDRNEYDSCRALIIKDVLLTGESLRSTFKTLEKYKIIPVALIIFVDLIMSSHWHQYVPFDTRVIRLVEGPDFPEIDD